MDHSTHIDVAQVNPAAISEVRMHMDTSMTIDMINRQSQHCNDEYGTLPVFFTFKALN